MGFIMKYLTAQKNLGIVLVLSLLLFSTMVKAQEEVPQDASTEMPNAVRSDRFDISFHYSRWTLDLVKSWFEEDLVKALSDEIRDEITAQIGGTHIGLGREDYEQNLAFDSGGANYGLEIRFYPRGREGAFSLGVSFEKTSMRLSVKGDMTQAYDNGTFAEAEAEGRIELNPFTTHLSFRWDLMPEWRVKPYLVLGLGIGLLDGEVSYIYDGTYTFGGGTDPISDEDIRTLKEMEEEIEFNIPNVLPIFQLNLGVQAEILPHMHLKAEAGIWNGFIFRLGVVYSF